MTRNELIQIAPAKKNRLNEKHAGGMPKFVPTDEQRNVVERAAGFGLPHDKICQLIISPRTEGPISKETLEKHFRAELDRGMAVADYAVGNAFFRNCTENMIPACQIWYTKSRMGWKETIVTESHEHRYDSMSTENIVKELEKRANRLGVKVDLRIG